MKSSNELLMQLKEHTKEKHQDAHELDFFKALSAHKLPKECYIGQLRTLAIIFGALERELKNSCPLFQKFLEIGYKEKLPLLLNDLYDLNPECFKENKKAISIALGVADNIMLLGTTTPVKLLGYLYTLEGSLMGAQTLISDLSKQFSLTDNQGISYLNSYGNDIGIYWKSFKTTLVEIVTPEEYDEVVNASSETFEFLLELYSTLYPLQKEEFVTHVAILNPEAGNLPIPSNPIILDASLEANKESWYLFPYLELCYGERGYRFGKSSVAWLATLCEMEQSQVNNQVEWLAKVLANLGMPSVILTQQLQILNDKLSLAGEKDALKLLEAAHNLQEKSSHILDAKTAQELASKFEKESVEEFSRKLRNSGDLIVSCIIDEYLGFTQQSTSFQTWMSDETRFSKQWSTSVATTIRKVNKAIEIQKFDDVISNAEVDSSDLGCENCPHISLKTIQNLQANKEDLLFEFNQCLSHNDEAQNLRGTVLYTMVYELHNWQLTLLSTILEFQNFNTIKESIAHDYRTYHNQGLPYEYFLESNKSWICAVRNVFNNEVAEELISFYLWLSNQHENIILISKREKENQSPMTQEQQLLVDALIDGNYETVVKNCESFLTQGHDISTLFITLLHPALVTIGNLWEYKKITSAQEHLATSVITRVLAEFYAELPYLPPSRGSAVVMTAQKEEHKIGAMIVAGALERDGWDVVHFDSNLSIKETVNFLKKVEPKFIAISLVAPFHIQEIKELVKNIRDEDTLKDMKIMGGGRVFDTMPEIIDSIDKNLCYIKDANEAVSKAREWV